MHEKAGAAIDLERACRRLSDIMEQRRQPQRRGMCLEVCSKVTPSSLEPWRVPEDVPDVVCWMFRRTIVTQQHVEPVQSDKLVLQHGVDIARILLEVPASLEGGEADGEQLDALEQASTA